MKSRKNQIQYLKLGIIIVMVIVFFSHQTFAADCNADTNETLTVVYEFLANLGRFFSWIWVVFSNFAGVLMTNTMVYGEFMGLDVSLWNIWQISRSIANYTLGFLFLYKIFKYIFVPGEKSPISKVKDFLLASVFIQASRFLVMVLFDLSTIILATVSSFPSQVIDSAPEVMTAVQQQVAKNSVLGNDKKTVIINAFSDSYLEGDNTKWFTVESATTTEGDDVVTPEKTTLDSLLPQTYNLGGTFLYLGFTAMKAQDYIVRPMPSAGSCEAKVMKVITGLILDSGLIILYSLSLAILVVLLVMRLVYLWIVIALSPIIVLLYFIKDIDIGKKNDIFDLKKAIYLIFQPAIYAFWMGLMFLFVVMVQNVFSSSTQSDLGSGIVASETKKSSTSTDPIPKINSSLENSGIVNFYIKEGAKSLKDILLSLFTLVLMRQFIKMAITWTMGSYSSSSGFAKRMNTLVDRTGEFFGRIPVVPTPEGGMGFNKVWNGYNSELLDGATGRIERALKGRDKSEQVINKLLGKPDAHVIQSLTNSQGGQLSGILQKDRNDPTEFISGLDSIRQENSGLIFSEVEGYVKDWVTKCKAKEYAVNTTQYDLMTKYFTKDLWDEICRSNDEIVFEKLFSGNSKRSTDGFKAFYTNVLGGNGKDAPKSYSEFMKNSHGRIEYTNTSSS